jgi:hypothetical protein
MLVGGLLAALKVLTCGRWCLCVFGGVYGWKKKDKSFEDRERTLEEI